jgi:Zn-dependent peptidase ImmA (M78 family)/transcriptional regulator with XRE-family HTH domain
MATELAPVTAAVLRWARETIGVSLEDAGRRAGVPAERVAAWEAGESEPTVAKLRALAKLYQRPLAIFFLPEPPKAFDAMRDFRKLPGQVDHTWSRALHKVYRRAIEQQEIAAELAEVEGETLSSRVPALDPRTSPEVAGAIARAALGVSLSQQFSWRQPDEAFAGWLEAVEDLGVFVLRTSGVSMAEMRGFSVSGGAVPVIVVNALDWPRGQVFTLLHEFVHLMIREGGLCDLLEPDSGATRRVETWCNAAAGAILMPRDSFLDNEVVGPAGEREWDDEVLAQLSRRYGASQEAVLRRLVTLRRASWEFYLAKRADYLAAYDEERQEQRARRREKSGGPPPHRMAIRDRGRPYVRLVLDAYQRDVISPSSLSNLLGLKLKHLSALEREVRT